MEREWTEVGKRHGGGSSRSSESLPTQGSRPSSVGSKGREAPSSRTKEAAHPLLFVDFSRERFGDPCSDTQSAKKLEAAVQGKLGVAAVFCLAPWKIQGENFVAACARLALFGHNPLGVTHTEGEISQPTRQRSKVILRDNQPGELFQRLLELRDDDMVFHTSKAALPPPPSAGKVGGTKAALLLPPPAGKVGGAKAAHLFPPSPAGGAASAGGGLVGGFPPRSPGKPSERKEQLRTYFTFVRKSSPDLREVTEDEERELLTGIGLGVRCTLHGQERVDERARSSIAAFLQASAQR
jgi:hypothetical protein